ncbi:MAG: methyltransferase [Bacteroidetes bacterium]|nr:methyltransferase [Bacteroidota bacterium]
MNLHVLIFSGSNDRAVIAFCRFACQHQVSISIISNGIEDVILNSDYKKFVIATRRKNILIVDEILEFANKARSISNCEKLIILPSTEYLNRFLLDNRLILSENNIVIPLCEKSIYELISDKYSFGELCKNENLHIPFEYPEKPNKYPFVIKPKYYQIAKQEILDKPAIIYNDIDFDNYFLNKNKSNYYFQEYIGGENYYLLFYISMDKDYSVYSQENFMQQSNGGSMILCKSSDIHIHEISNKFAELFIKIGFYGLVMVEVKHFNNQFYMIEANPRLWGPSQLIVDSGMNLFAYLLNEYGLSINLNEFIYKNDKWYFWSGGIKNTQVKNETFYNFNSDDFYKNYKELLQAEIYLKNDTKDIYLMENTTPDEELIQLYKNTSKHSSYQILPQVLKNLVGTAVSQAIPRFEAERWSFVCKHISFNEANVLDIGGNTGYFSFESIEAGAKKVVYIEGNTAHANFVEKASKKLNMNIHVFNKYLNFKDNLNESQFDIVLLFNVIHHLGDDFGDNQISLDEAKKEMQHAINYFQDKTKWMVLQLGFCWKGDRNSLLFKNGTKKEMIDFVESAIGDKWTIKAIGIAEENQSITEYQLLNERNIVRSDLLGEFRNRPIFILESKSIG